MLRRYSPASDNFFAASKQFNAISRQSATLGFVNF